MKKSMVRPERRVLNPRARFRALVNVVIANSQWLREVPKEFAHEDSEVQMILMKTKKEDKSSILTRRDRSLLMKKPKDRTEQEIKEIADCIKNLKCFLLYTQAVIERLAGAIYCIFYGPERIILKEGHVGYILYFVLSGDIEVTVTKWDRQLEKFVDVTIGHRLAGDMFGEVALLYNIPRTARVTTKSDCELLCLKKEDFAEILQDTVQQHWTNCQRVIQQFSYFKDWDDVGIRELCILSKIMIFSPDETIFGDGQGLPDYVYFVAEGKCQLIHQLRVMKTKSGDYKLCKPAQHDLKANESVETFFMQVCVFTKGQSFGIGENFEDRRIVALSEVQCLLCPYYWLMKYNRANIWVRIQQFLDKSIPSSEEIFKLFLDQRKWLKYRQKLVKNILRQRRIPNDTCLQDVPYFIRINYDTKADRHGYENLKELQEKKLIKKNDVKMFSHESKTEDSANEHNKD